MAIALATFAKLELEKTVFVEDLDAMVVGVGNNDVVLGIDRNSRWLCKLAFHNAEFSETTMVNLKKFFTKMFSRCVHAAIFVEIAN